MRIYTKEHIPMLMALGRVGLLNDNQKVQLRVLASLSEEYIPSCNACDVDVATVHELCWSCMVDIHGDPFDV